MSKKKYDKFLANSTKDIGKPVIESENKSKDKMRFVKSAMLTLLVACATIGSANQMLEDYGMDSMLPETVHTITLDDLDDLATSLAQRRNMFAEIDRNNTVNKPKAVRIG